MNVIAHLSDIHIDADPRSASRAQAVMDHLNSLDHDFDVILVSGDIADHGLPEEYERARELLTSRHPVLICPGNHDDRAAFRQFLLRSPMQPGPANNEPVQVHREPGQVDSKPVQVDSATSPINQVHRADGFLLAACDSSIPGKAEGFLEDETLAWLDAVLSEAPDVPALVAFHHPPTVLHVPYVDEIRQYGEQRLAQLLDTHPNVVALLSGHAHTSAATTFAGRPLLVAPGVVSTLRLPWEPQDTIVDLDVPPSLAFHVLDDTGHLTTHYRTILPTTQGH